MQFFKLRKHSKTCDDCKAFLENELYSTLLEDESRRDQCSSCFASTEKPAIWWKTKIEKQTKQLILTEYERDLYNRFTSWVEEKSKGDEWLSFLVHYFKRRKIFLSQGECQKEGKVFEILECKLTQEVFVIPKTTPTQEAISEIVKELCHRP